jgi:hypothetical protein
MLVQTEPCSMAPKRTGSPLSRWLLCLFGLIWLPALSTVLSGDQPPWMISSHTARGLFSDRASGNPPVAVPAPAAPAKMQPADSLWQMPDGAWKYLVIHHSGTSSGSVQSIHREHQQRRDADGDPWLGIAYHFVIGNGSGMADGQVQATFRWDQQLHGAHAGNALINARGIGICLIGDFEKTAPSTRQLDALRKLVVQLAGRYQISRRQVIGHSSVRSTRCPGRLFPLRKIQEAVPQA